MANYTQNKWLKKIFGDPSKKTLAVLTADAQLVNDLEGEISKLTDEELKVESDKLKGLVAQGTELDLVAHRAFALVRETAKRTLGQRHFDVQIMGGMALHRGMIAEMRTGEGKTLTSTAPIYLNALLGLGVHVVTVNDYLAKRDAVWMGQIFSALGLSVGVIQHEGGYVYDATFKADEQDDNDRDTTGSFRVQMDFLRPVDRKAAYAADITYGTNNQFGFDYLRDNMAGGKDQIVQRGLAYAVVDEIDSILIDEARTPLIISAAAEESADLYVKFATLVTKLTVNDDYNIDEKLRVATFTDAGLKKIEDMLGVENLYATGGLALVHHAEQALKAHAIFKKDKDYVVADGEVKIVDEFTGRIMEGRRYSEGLHQAIEAKERVEIKRESRTLATITFQNYFRMYKKLSGMTGTALTEAEEFLTIYGLEVVEVPTNKPIAREDETDRIYKTEAGKFGAVVEEVRKRRDHGQPVLIGTASIEKNELLDAMLTQAKIPHETLNAKNHEREAQIIAQAGTPGSVTLATNMAGRGVDIVLGGNPSSKEEQEVVRGLGGLHVIGTERHEARRIDNQLRGRSGRQGDPGSTQFFVSLEDDLMRIFGSDRIKGMMNTLGMDESTPIESKMITNSLEKAQIRVEGHNFDTRKRVLEYDDVLNKHRTGIYERRRAILLDDAFDARKEVRDMMESEIERVVLFHTGEVSLSDAPEEFRSKKTEGDWDPKEILETFGTILDIDSEFEKLVRTELAEVSPDKERLAAQRSAVIEGFMSLIDRKLTEFTSQVQEEARIDQALRMVLLRTMDNAWVHHLETMNYLRRSIGLRGYGQRDPLVEYKREAFQLYNEMQVNIEREVVYNAFKVLKQTAVTHRILTMAPSILEKANIQLSGGSSSPLEGETGRGRNGQPTIVKTSAFEKVGRNDLCPCGSGKKYKKCHGA